MSEKAAPSRHRRRPSQGIFMLPDDLSAPPPENSGGNIVVPPPSQAPPLPRHGGAAPPQAPAVKSAEEMSKDLKCKSVSDEGSKES
ncbi:hypothetical protein ACET3Z_009412 [Daucus carota]